MNMFKFVDRNLKTVISIIILIPIAIVLTVIIIQIF
jgi:hypothetical protein